MINIRGLPGEFRFTVEVTRKDTGKVETYELIGREAAEQEGEDDDADSLDNR